MIILVYINCSSWLYVISRNYQRFTQVTLQKYEPLFNCVHKAVSV
jgi:hypothetical protein